MAQGKVGYRRLRSAMLRAVGEAGELARARFGTSFRVEEKKPGDLVSLVDRGAERAVRQVLTAAFPGAGILGEEGGWEPGARELVRTESEQLLLVAESRPVGDPRGTVEGRPRYRSLGRAPTGARGRTPLPPRTPRTRPRVRRPRPHAASAPPRRSRSGRAESAGSSPKPRPEAPPPAAPPASGPRPRAGSPGAGRWRPPPSRRPGAACRAPPAPPAGRARSAGGG